MSEMQSLTRGEILSVLKLAASESKRNHAMILTNACLLYYDAVRRNK